MDNIVRFVSKSELERERLIREARAIYDSIFPPASGAGLDAPHEGSVNTLNELLSVEGALDLLSAYQAIANRDLRRALLLHARTLAHGVGAHGVEHPAEPTG